MSFSYHYHISTSLKGKQKQAQRLAVNDRFKIKIDSCKCPYATGPPSRTNGKNHNSEKNKNNYES